MLYFDMYVRYTIWTSCDKCGYTYSKDFDELPDATDYINTSIKDSCVDCANKAKEE